MNAKTARVALGMVLLTSVSLNLAPINLVQPACAKPQTEQQSLPQVFEEMVDKKAFQVIRMVVNAHPERVWQILSDYANAPNIFDNLKKCELLEDHGQTKIVKHVIHPSNWPSTFEYVLEIKENGPRAMEWHRVRGAFREVDGFWKLEPLQGGKATQVTYSAHVNGGLFLPSPMIKAQMRNDMPNVMLALKSSAENVPTQIASHGAHIRNN